MMNNNIKKAPVNFWEDLLYFQHFMQIFCFCSKSVIITTLTYSLNIPSNDRFMYTFYLKALRNALQRSGGAANIPTNDRVPQDWLVGCFGFNGPLRQYFSLYRAVSKREGEIVPTASAVGPCPTVIQIVGRLGTGSLPSTIAPPDYPLSSPRQAYQEPPFPGISHPIGQN